VLDQPAEERVVAVLRIELEQERLAPVATADARGFERLQRRDRATEFRRAAVEPEARRDREQTLVVLAEQSVVVEARDEQLHPLAHERIEFLARDLQQEERARAAALRRQTLE